MKKILFIFIVLLSSANIFAQTDTTLNAADTTHTDSVANPDEAGGISPDEIAKNNTDTSGGLWIGIAGGAGVVVGMILYSLFFNKKKKEEEPVANELNSKLFIDESVAPGKAPSAADIKKLKEENKLLRMELQHSKDETAAYKKNLDVYQTFDTTYYNEAFKKLVSPLNEAMEKGSRKDMLETMLKIAAQYSSLTRYKISKKQPYDEANMQYLMNQRMKNDIAVEIDGQTPLDKIPKNIKPIIDMLSEQSSKGLDDSIIAGYKVKNL